MSEIVYEAEIFTRKISYKNYNGLVQTVQLDFSLDPLSLLELIASVPVAKSKSNNPAKRDDEVTLSDSDQVALIRRIAEEAAGHASKDGETWERWENMSDSLAGKAFLTRLSSSDTDRREFVEKVVISPFRAFVSYAKSDPTNSQADIAGFDEVLHRMERIFDTPEGETIEDRKARLMAELSAIGDDE